MKKKASLPGSDTNVDGQDIQTPNPYKVNTSNINLGFMHVLLVLVMVPKANAAIVKVEAFNRAAIASNGLSFNQGVSMPSQLI